MAQLRSETLEHLGLDPDDLDSSGSVNLDLLINRSWWDVCDRFKFTQKEQITTFNTVSGVRSYLLQTITGSDIFEAIQNISITTLNDLQHIPLDTISYQWYEANYNEQVSLQQQPTAYFHHDSHLYLYPTPDVVYTITVYYNFVLSDLTAGDPIIPQSWHESILYGAIARGFRRGRDYTSAREMDQAQELTFLKRATTEAKEDANIKMSGVEIIRNKYSVRH